MRYLFLAPPAAGEMQPVLAVAAALLHLQPQATVCIASASSFDGAFQRFKSSLDDSVAARLLRSDIGRTDDVEDYSRRMLARDPSKHPRLFGTHRHARGNPIPFFDYWQAFAAGSEEQRLATIQRILRLVDAIRPDMIIVDQIYGTPYDGESIALPPFGSRSWSRATAPCLHVLNVTRCLHLCPSPLSVELFPFPGSIVVTTAVRYSKLPFVVIAPGHPSFAAGTSPQSSLLNLTSSFLRLNLSLTDT